MKQNCKILVVSMLAVSLTAGPLFFGFATPAAADTSSCLAGILAGIGLGTSATSGANGAAGLAATSVPTFDAANHAMNNA